MKYLSFIFSILLMSFYPSSLGAQERGLGKSTQFSNPRYPFPKEAESTVVDLHKTRDVFGNGKVFLYEFEYNGLLTIFTNDATVSKPLENVYTAINNMSWFPGHQPDISFRTSEMDGKHIVWIYAYNYFPNALDQTAYVTCTIVPNSDKVEVDVTIPKTVTKAQARAESE